MVRLGLIGRADKTGLSVQTHAYWRHLSPHRTLVVDLSRHSRVKPDMSMYDNATMWNDKVYPALERPVDPVLEDFLQNVDVVLTCETPYNYWLFERAKELGVKTILQFNYEFLDYSRNKLPEPDLFLAPSTWYLDKVKKDVKAEVRFVPVPVDRDLFPFQKRTELKTLLHTAGTVAMEDRNGTVLSAQAMGFVESDVELIVKSQNALKLPKKKVKLRIGAVPTPNQLYTGEDVYVMPRKFGGLCLPLNEAVSCGMPVIVSDCSPQVDWVPEELRVKAVRTKSIETRNTIDLYECDPRDVAAKIDWLATNPAKVQEYSEWANEHAESISWRKMKEVYEKILAE